MADQIIVFKNGERVITELQEVFDGEGDDKRGICLLMSHPYILELVEVSNPENPTQDLQVKFSKWCPYSVDYQFRVPYDTILAIGEPDQGLNAAYRQKIEQLTVATGTAPESSEKTPQQELSELGWEEGKDNPNIIQQRADIEAVKNGINIEKLSDSSVE